MSDITASSEFGLDGIVEISNPDTSISRALVEETPPAVADADNLFKTSYCKVNLDSKFVITGRGGLPLSPEQGILPEYTWEDWRVTESDTAANSVKSDNISLSSPPLTKPKLTPIQGWMVNRQSQIVLTANPIMVTPQVATTKPLGCK